MLVNPPGKFRKHPLRSKGSAAPAPPPVVVHVVNVTQADDPPGIIWTFSRNIASAALPIAGLTTDGNPVTGILSFLGSELIVSYSSYPDVADPWAALSLVTGITFVGGGAVAPASGIVLPAPKSCNH